MSKKFIIIGASSGVGKALALLLASQGHLVGIGARQADKLETIKQLYPEKIKTKLIDVNNYQLANKQTKELITDLGGLDVLIISAGIGYQNPGLDLDKELKTIQTNVIGFVAIANLAFDYFVKQGSGQLIGITSLMGIRGEQGAPAYAATKSFQGNYLEGLRQRANRLHLPITVTEVQPGFMQTKMGEGDHVFWSAPLNKAAKQIAKAIAKKRDHVYITKRWFIIAWLLKITPRGIYKKLRFSKDS